MTTRPFEIVDRNHPTWRGMRFSTLANALRELGHAVPPERFYVRDNQTHLAYRQDGTIINAP